MESHIEVNFGRKDRGRDICLYVHICFSMFGNYE